MWVQKLFYGTERHDVVALIGSILCFCLVFFRWSNHLKKQRAFKKHKVSQQHQVHGKCSHHPFFHRCKFRFPLKRVCQKYQCYLKLLVKPFFKCLHTSLANYNRLVFWCFQFHFDLILFKGGKRPDKIEIDNVCTVNLKKHSRIYFRF